MPRSVSGQIIRYISALTARSLPTNYILCPENFEVYKRMVLEGWGSRITWSVAWIKLLDGESIFLSGPRINIKWLFFINSWVLKCFSLLLLNGKNTRGCNTHTRNRVLGRIVQFVAMGRFQFSWDIFWKICSRVFVVSLLQNYFAKLLQKLCTTRVEPLIKFLQDSRKCIFQSNSVSIYFHNRR